MAISYPFSTVIVEVELSHLLRPLSQKLGSVSQAFGSQAVQEHGPLWGPPATVNLP